MSTKLVLGAGVNDVDYVVQKKVSFRVEGKRKGRSIWICPYYRKWFDMLTRCYSEVYKNKYPTYKGCTVHPDWLYLSNFIKWVDEQPNKDWANCHLDKDFLVEGNKHYSPENCVFLDKNINLFIIDRGGDRGDYLLGVSWQKINNKFKAQCSNPFKNSSQYIGLFDTELEAHLAWKARKHQYACQLADLQDDERVAGVLRTKYTSAKGFN